MKTFTALCMSVVLFFMGIFTPEVPQPKSVEALDKYGDICHKFDIADEIYVIDCIAFKSTEERHLAVSLQGIVAREKSAIFIINNEISRKYLEIIEKSGKKLVYKDSEDKPWTIQSLLAHFKNYIDDSGYVLYRPDEKAVGLNIATNYASLYGWLPVPESLKALAEDNGLVLKEDLSDDEYSVKLQERFFNEHKKEFKYDAVVSLKYEATGLRDLAIQQGFYIFYIDDDEDSDRFRGKVIKYAGDNVPVLGWAKHELQYVSQASENGNMVIPSDHSHNNSILASFDYEVLPQKHTKTNKYTDKTKHYCALVFSDGDNVQWIQNGYSEYFEKLALEKQFPVTWSFSPLMQEFSPVTANMVYSVATEDDYFIAGVSGAGYIHPSEYPRKALEKYTDLTAAAMLESDMEYVSILDNTPENEIDEAKLVQSLQYYTRYDNIKGGVLSLDPDRYAGGKGRVYFVDDKPFVSNRFSLWHPDGEGADVTESWLKEQADIINSCSADINSIDGYSVVNIHPWTISVENLSYFVSQLDDDVQLVTLDELLTMVEENVPHESATPKTIEERQ